MIQSGLSGGSGANNLGAKYSEVWPHHFGFVRRHHRCLYPTRQDEFREDRRAGRLSQQMAHMAMRFGWSGRSCIAAIDCTW